jgi:transcriptional regulator with XRE-family HTH domain
METEYLQKEINTIAELGSFLRKKRKKMGLSLQEASGICDVGIRFLSEIERGKDSAEIGKVLQVIHRLGLICSLSDKGLKE